MNGTTLAIRVIPIVLYDGSTAVKPVSFARPARPVGSVVQVARTYAMRQVDEIVFLDIAARREGRGPDLATVESFARELMGPFAVGGGVRDLEDVKALLDVGADKVVIGIGGMRVRGRLLEKIAEKYGRQMLVVAIDAVRVEMGSSAHPQIWTVWDHVEGKPTGGDAMVGIRTAASRGAGEILLTSVDREGTRTGYDVELIKRAVPQVEVPVIAHGGCGIPAHAIEALAAGASAVAAASIFHFTEHRPIDLREMLGAAGYPIRGAA